MATYTDSHGFNRGSASYPAKGYERMSFFEVLIDLPDIVAARSEAGATALAANDVLQVIPLPAGSFVLEVGVDVTTAEGEAGTLDVGDGSDADGYHDGIDFNAVAHYTTALALTEAAPNTVTGYSNGKFYSSADTIDVKFLTATPTLAVFRVWALVLNCNTAVGT